MSESLFVINASASDEPVYVFVTPNPAWRLADGFVTLATLVLPVGELAGLVRGAIDAVKIETGGESVGLFADLGDQLTQLGHWLENTWVGETMAAGYERAEKVITTVMELREQFSAVLTLKSILSGLRNVVLGKAELEAAAKRADEMFRNLEDLFIKNAYLVRPLARLGFDEISKNPLDYLGPSGWAALADADTAHLTVYRKGRYLADFNAHARSSYVCAEELVWRIPHNGSWSERSELIHGITPVHIGAKPTQDIECAYLHSQSWKGDVHDGYKPQDILRVRIKPEHRVLPMELRVDLRWHDQGTGNQKGMFRLWILRDGVAVHLGPNQTFIEVGPAPHTEEALQLRWAEDSALVSNLKAGDELVLGVVVGAGGGHELNIPALLVTLPLSTLIYRAPPLDTLIRSDKEDRTLVWRFPLITHPHAAIPGRERWVPKIHNVNVWFNWQANTVWSAYERQYVIEHGKSPGDADDGLAEEISLRVSQNNSVGTHLEVWRGGVKTADERIWDRAPGPQPFDGPDIWNMALSPALLAASQLSPGPDDTPVEWAICVWYQPDNHWMLCPRDTHLQIFTSALHVEYKW